MRATQTDVDGDLVIHPCCAPPVGVSCYPENIQNMIFKFNSDGISIFGSKMLFGGLVSEVMRSMTQICAAIGWTIFSRSFSGVFAS